MHEDEKKVNLIKCPLPKIIYMSIKGLASFSKKPEKSSNTTYYTKKLSHQQPGLPSLKMTSKLSFSPNKTNYTKELLSKKLNNLNVKRSLNINNNQINADDNNKIDNNKVMNKKQSMKEILNSYGLNRYYEKLIQSGINENNFNQIGHMNKKMFNNFINILNIFPSHIIKMEQLHLHLKKMNSENNNFHSQLNISNNNTINNIHINNSAKDINNNSNLNSCHIEVNSNSSINNNNSHNNNNVNYITLTFNRTNLSNLKTRVSHSQNRSKYRVVNSNLKQKRVNSNRLSSEKNKTKKNNTTNYTQKPNLGNKNKSKTKLLNDNIMSKINFAPPKPINLGRNDLIKYFFRDLENMNTNSTGINNLTHFNLFINKSNKKNNNFSKTNNNSLTGSLKELNKEKKENKGNNNTYFTKYREKHSAPDNINIQESKRSNLPKIKNMNNKNIKINTQYSKSLLINKNESFNGNIKKNIKTSYNKLNKNMKNGYDKKVDNSKVINAYQVDFSVKTFFNNKEIKNINKNNNINIDDINSNLHNKKNSLKGNVNINSNRSDINTTYAPHKTQIDISKKITNNYEIKLKLPNVIKKIGVQNANVANKNKQRNKDIKDLKLYKEGDKNIYLSSSHISLISKKSDNKLNKNLSIKTKEQIDPEINKMNQYEKINNNYMNSDNNLKNKEINIISNIEENKKDKININKSSEKKNNIQLENYNNILPDKNNLENKKINESEINIQKNDNINNNIINIDKNISNNSNTILENQIEKENINKQVKEKIENKENGEIKDNIESLETIVFESLRLNHSFSENKKENIFQFDAEFLCRCLGLCLSILIETSKESPHITEINLEVLSASEIKYFFFNELYNDNMNLLFDVFDKEVNTNVNKEQISPLDKLEIILSQNNKERVNYDISYLKHIKKENDEPLIKAEEEKEKEIENNENKIINNIKANTNMIGINNREGFKIRTGLGDIEGDIKMIDEFFSINNRKKKKAKNYNFISDMSKNILCKELSYINEIDSELNGTNSNINNTNIGNNSNNNINDKNTKEENASNIMDNEDIKEIKEIQNNNAEEENNNTFNNEMNELGIITENNDNNENINKNSQNNTLKNISNNSINIKEDEGNEIPENKKEININNDNNSDKNDNNKNISLVNNEENNNNISDKDNNDKENNSKNSPLKINENNNEQENDNKVQLNNNIILETKEPENNINISSEIKIIKEEGQENIYESDYILDIISIEELTYYLIKRAEIFDEDFNYMYMKIIERRYIPTPEPQTIYDFMADIIILTKMEKEVIVLSLIYIERLIFNTGLLLTSRNWRRILLTAMIISSKVWDDNSFENDHFSQVFANLGVNEINTLERIFLELINYKVYVKQSEYYKYLMLIKIIAMKYSYNGREIVKASIIKNMKYKEFNETMQNRMRKKVTLNNSAQF